MKPKHYFILLTGIILKRKVCFIKYWIDRSRGRKINSFMKDFIYLQSFFYFHKWFIIFIVFNFFSNFYWFTEETLCLFKILLDLFFIVKCWSFILKNRIFMPPTGQSKVIISICFEISLRISVEHFIILLFCVFIIFGKKICICQVKLKKFYIKVWHLFFLSFSQKCSG